MSSVDGFRRIFPAPRRRPGLLAVLVRWRVEILLGIAVAALWWWVGGPITSLLVAALALLAIGVPKARKSAVGLLQAVVVPHRVRSGLLQAGVTDRDGRLPWVLGAWRYGEAVFVYVWLRAGTTFEDLRQARQVVAGACGAAYVEVTRRSARRDRAIMVVYRPRWGWFGE
jgi:hypothetical protein